MKDGSLQWFGFVLLWLQSEACGCSWVSSGLYMTSSSVLWSFTEVQWLVAVSVVLLVFRVANGGADGGG
jgi:hypothetical protein